MICIRLDELLKERKLRPREFSDGAGLRYRTVLDIVYRRVTRLDLSTLDAICAYLHVQPGQVLAHQSGTQPRRKRRPVELEPAHPEGCRCYDCLFPREPDVFRPEAYRIADDDWEDHRDG